MTEFDPILQRLQDQVANAQATPVDLPVASAEGTSADEQVRVSVAAGKVEQITIDARSMRLTNVELAEKLVEAVNAAIDAHGAAIVAAMEDDSTDFGQLNRGLDEIRADANQTMTKYLDAMTEMLGRASGQR